MAAPEAKISRFPRLPLIWVVPIVAVVVAGWTLYREWRSHGADITIEFADGTGLQSNETNLEYKGVSVGQVEQVSLAKDFNSVVVSVQLARNATSLAREGSQFWVVQPEIGFAGVSGLDTLLSGVHLGVNPGHGKPATHFRGLDAPPAPDNTKVGPAFILQADSLGVLQLQAPVFYREVKVGEVEATRLADDATGVLIRIRIQRAYGGLIHVNTRFWDAGSSPLQFSLFGGSSQKKSLQSVITGAIAFATPEDSAGIAPDGAQFPLVKEPDKAWLNWRPRIPIKSPETAPEKSDTSKVLPGLLGGN